MKKVFLGLIAVSMLAACDPAPATNNAAKKDSTATVSAADLPVIKFENESHDFGKIKTGDVVQYDFKFTNTGKSPLIITHASATCGCTTPEYPKAPVAPGASGVIHVVFNSAGKTGLQDKQITVSANTIPPETKVHLVGEVLSATTK